MGILYRSVGEGGHGSVGDGLVYGGIDVKLHDTDKIARHGDHPSLKLRVASTGTRGCGGKGGQIDGATERLGEKD